MVTNRKETAAKAVLLTGDIVLAAATLLVATLVRYGSTWSFGATFEPHLAAFSAVIVLNLVSHYAFRLYEAAGRPTNAELFMASLRSQVIAAMVGAAFFYFMPPTILGLEPRRVLLGYAFGFLVATWLWHVSARRIMRHAIPPLNVLILGDGAPGVRLAQQLERIASLGYRVAGLCPAEPEAIRNAIERHQPDTIVNATGGPLPPDAIEALRSCLVDQRPVTNVAAFTEQVMQKIAVEDVEHGWFIENFSLRRRPLYEAGKRASDIVLSAGLLVATLPFLPFIALAVKSTPGPLLFRQQRAGRHGKPFGAMKFRSMVADAEANGPQWSSKNDSRITGAGKFLRATRLDEIPQLLNILRGEMSFVGPRPERPEFVATLEQQIPFYAERHLVKPGLTGWAQINYPYGDSVQDALEKLRYDLYYIKNRSALLDLSTVLKTVNTVLRGLGR